MASFINNIKAMGVSVKGATTAIAALGQAAQKLGVSMSGANKSPEIVALHCYGGNNDKIYVAVIEDLQNGHFATKGYYGKRTASNLTAQQKCSGTFATCRAEMQSLVQEKLNKGYKDVDDPYSYKVPHDVSITLDECMKKIDLTRVVGLVESKPMIPTSNKSNLPGGKSTSTKSEKPKKQPEPGRANRQIRF